MDEEEATWVKLGKAMTNYKRAKREFKQAKEDLDNAAKNMPVKLDMETISVAASDQEN